MAEITTWEGKTAVVAGAGRGFGLGVANALAARRMHVIALSRSGKPDGDSAAGAAIEHVSGDAADEITAARILDEVRPDLVVMCAGARPLLRPIQLHTWETFSQNWQVDAKAAFTWLRNALLLPLKPGTHIVVVSSGAAIHGSVLSGGYAGSKRTQWFMTKYAALEAERNQLGLRIQCLLPNLSPTGMGRLAMAAYAARAGLSLEEFSKRFQPPVTPEVVGNAVVELHEKPEVWNQVAYQVDGKGLSPAP